MSEVSSSQHKWQVCVVGAGPVGRTLAGIWDSAGHHVVLAVRDPNDPKHAAIRARLPLVALRALPPADATLLAIPGPAVAEFVSDQVDRLDGRLLIDATNNLTGGALHQLFLLGTQLPSSVVYRAFNTFGWETFRSEIAGEQPDLLYSGPDPGQRELVESLVGDTGMRPIYVGDGVPAADALDGLSRLWWLLAFRRGLDHTVAMRLLGDGQGDDALPRADPVRDDTRDEGPRRRVAVIGAGEVGRALGASFARAGHRVIYGGRGRPDAISASACPQSEQTRVVPVADALEGADVAVLTVPAGAVSEVVAEHRSGLSRCLVIDATNNLEPGRPDHSRDIIVSTVDGVRYARAFNTLGVEVLRYPGFADVAADMFFSSSEADRASVADLIRAAGMRPVWLGANRHDVVDDAFRLWMSLARTRGRRFAFRILTQDESRL
jgi:8-hydroxy-5-deazaflavin:NADPH oxidoreductase